jgi:uncharacterized membrane protein
MEIKPWHIVMVLIVVAVIAFAVWVVRAFRNGRRG